MTTRPVAAGPVVASPELEDGLVALDGLVVVTGRSLTSTAATVDDALRRILGGRSVIEVSQPWGCDLARILTLARQHAPVVVLVADAPLSLLDQIGPEARRLVDGQARLVVTSRFVDAFLAPEVRAILAPVTIRLPDPDDGDTPSREKLTGRAADLVDVVVDRDRLGVEHPLQFDELCRLSDASTDEHRRLLWSALRQALRGGGVRATRRHGVRHLAPAPAGVDAAERDGRPIHPQLAARLAREHWTSRGALRVALARADDVAAEKLLGQLALGSLPVEQIVALAESAEDRAEWTVAAERFAAAAARAEGPLAARTRRSAGLCRHRAGDRHGARALLEDAGEDPEDRVVQDVLARIALSTAYYDGTAVHEARRRLRLLAAGEDDLAFEAEAELAELAADAGDDDEARTRAERVLAADPPPERALTALLAAARARSRTGDHEGATAVVGKALDLVPPNATQEMRDEVALVQGEVLLAAGNLTAAGRALSPLRPTPPRTPSTRLAVALAELALAQERWPAVFADTPEWNVLLVLLDFERAGSTQARALWSRRIDVATRVGRPQLAARYRKAVADSGPRVDGRFAIRTAGMIAQVRARQESLQAELARAEARRVSMRSQVQVNVAIRPA